VAAILERVLDLI